MKNLATTMLRRLKGKSDIERFFDLPFAERNEIIRTAYSEDVKRSTTTGLFERTEAEIVAEISGNFRPFFDIMLGYAKELRPASVMELGCYVAMELQWLQFHGYQGTMIAADHSKSYLDYLKAGFAKTRFNGFEYRDFDLDRAEAADFKATEMVVAMAVLSNVQPETIGPLFKTMSDSGVKSIIIGDMYSQSSLSGDPRNSTSTPLTTSRNWCHCYRAHGHINGYETIFLPDMTYNSYREARGIFILTKDVGREQHERAMALATQNYLNRQRNVWDRYPTLRPL